MSTLHKSHKCHAEVLPKMPTTFTTQHNGLWPCLDSKWCVEPEPVLLTQQHSIVAIVARSIVSNTASYGSGCIPRC